MNKRTLALVLILFASSIIVAGILLSDSGRCDTCDEKFYTYPLSEGDKTFVVSLETNWTGENAPKVSLINSSNPSQYAIELYFLGRTEKNVTWESVTYNITFPNGLLGEDISLIHKYYLQDPSSYSLGSNSTHTWLQMTFDYSPYFSGSGYFVIKETEATD